MSLIVNGTTIPTNVANTLMVNGVSVTSIMCNGTNAWLQSLVVPLVTGWSGNSYSYANWGEPLGHWSSGMLFKARWGILGVNAAWITVNTNGTFTGNSSAYFTIYTSGSSMQYGNGTWITYDPATKQFSGSTAGNTYGGVNYGYTSGTFMRYYYGGQYGAWISLN